MIALAGLDGVDKSLYTSHFAPSLKTKSVNVPPVSTPIMIILPPGMELSPCYFKYGIYFLSFPILPCVKCAVSDNKPDTTQFGYAVHKMIAWRSYEHEIDRDVPFFRKVLYQLRTESPLDFDKFYGDIGIKLSKEIKVLLKLSRDFIIIIDNDYNLYPVCMLVILYVQHCLVQVVGIVSPGEEYDLLVVDFINFTQDVVRQIIKLICQGIDSGPDHKENEL